MNTVEAFLFQSELDAWRVVIVWKRADIGYYFGNDDWNFIGTVQSDTEAHKIVKG